VYTEVGLFLLRASGTEPLVRITAEARDERAAAELFATAQELIENAIESV
jgi:phosphoglucosamine mutase